MHRTASSVHIRGNEALALPMGGRFEPLWILFLINRLRSHSGSQARIIGRPGAEAWPGLDGLGEFLTACVVIGSWSTVDRAARSTCLDAGKTLTQRSIRGIAVSGEADVKTHDSDADASSLVAEHGSEHARLFMI